MPNFTAISGITAVGLGALAVSGLVAGAPVTPGHSVVAGMAAESVPPPKWTRCAGLPSAARARSGRFRCATLKAPLDYARPSGEKIDIALIKAPATSRGHRLGSLLFNFGGPGGDGVDTL